MPAYSRRHYLTTAQMLGALYHTVERDCWNTIVVAFTMMFSHDNAAFDGGKFSKVVSAARKHAELRPDTDKGTTNV
ncbi:hypothetical protein HC928_05015 [bacterium]|nr:hypothetical protein [bacterium]